MSKLESCPFCGSNELEIKCLQHNTDEFVYSVECLDCECEGPADFTRNNAKRGWNVRAERRWISIEERLPEEDVPVLCIDSRGVQMVAWSGWGEWCGPEIEAEITHWMPLPPLPGEEVQK